MAENSTQTVGAPQVECEKYHAILSVPDVQSAVEFYTTRLGFWLAFAEGDPPTFAGVNLGSVQMFLENGTACPAGCSAYFVVNDADTLYRFHRSNGVEILEAPANRPYGLWDYTVRDCYGYRLTFGNHTRSKRKEE